MHRIQKILLFLFILLSVPVVSLAQAATGELSITITDPSGAIVKDAEVTITGTDTGATVRVLKTNERGIAAVPLLQPGRYNTHIASTGFKTVDRNGVTVSVGSIISLDLVLELGESTDVITVNGEAPLIEDKSETLAQVISSKEVTDIPRMDVIIWKRPTLYLERSQLQPVATTHFQLTEIRACRMRFCSMARAM